MTDQPTPQTEAGRRLLGLDMGPQEAYWVNLGSNEMRLVILAIEAEARAAVYLEVGAIAELHEEAVEAIEAQARTEALDVEALAGSQTDRLQEAIEGERRFWHTVEVRPDDLAAVLEYVAVTFYERSDR